MTIFDFMGRHVSPMLLKRSNSHPENEATLLRMSCSSQCS